jgi:two-component system cell cycle sensor histidine kinase/response regulator CckA
VEKTKILIVEDEAIIARDLQRRLEGQHYTVTGAVSTGEDAIRRAEKDSPDLVLMDIVLLGEMDGIEAAGKIRSLFDIPVVYVTAYADEGILERAKVTQPFGYILKPFDDRELRSVIEMALYKSAVEKQLRKNNEFLNNIIESLSHPFYVINAEDYTVTMANSASHFGALTGKNTCYSLTHHGDTPCEGDEHPCTIREISRTGKPVIQEHIHYDHEGNARTFEVHGYPLFDAQGRVAQVIEYTLDITDRKTLENQFRQSQKMESVGRLAGGVAHDFNNLLTAIMGYSELALADLPEENPVRKYVSVIAEAGDKAETLVRQLLAFSRKQTLDMRTVNLNDIVQNFSKMLRLVIGEDLMLELNLRPSVRNVKADAGQIEQLLMNLSVNARDAMPCGGRLTVETDNVELGEEYAKTHAGVIPGPYVMLAVTDTGTGMSREVQERLFEPFFTTKGSRGTGLGLATVYGIVKQHNGSIYVYSEEKIGTTIKVYLPATAEEVEASHEKERETLDIRGTETILVVDDEPSIRRLIFDTLEPLGYHVMEASCGKEALQRIDTIKGGVDLLLTDVVMPDINGRELADIIKAKSPAVKVLFMSGYTGETVEQHGLTDMKNRFLQKPLTPKKLLMKIREILEAGQ